MYVVWSSQNRVATRGEIEDTIPRGEIEDTIPRVSGAASCGGERKPCKPQGLVAQSLRAGAVCYVFGTWL